MKNLWLVVFAAVCTVFVGYIVTTFDEASIPISQQQQKQQSSSCKKVEEDGVSNSNTVVVPSIPDLFGEDVTIAFKQIGYDHQHHKVLLPKGQHPTMSKTLKKRWEQLLAIDDLELFNTGTTTPASTSINFHNVPASVAQLASEVYQTSLYELNHILDFYNAAGNNEMDEPVELIGSGMSPPASYDEEMPRRQQRTTTIENVITSSITDAESIGWWSYQMGRRKPTAAITPTNTMKDMVWLAEYLQALHRVLIHPMWADYISIHEPCFSSSLSSSSNAPPSTPTTCMEAVSTYFTKVASGGVGAGGASISAALLVPVSYYHGIVLPKYRVLMMSTNDYIEDQLLLQNTTTAGIFAAGAMRHHANDLLIGIDHLRLLGVLVNLLDQGFPRMVSPYAVPLSGRLDIVLQQYQRSGGGAKRGLKSTTSKNDKNSVRTEAIQQLRTSLLGYTDTFMCPILKSDESDNYSADFVGTVSTALCHKFMEEMVLPTRGIEGRVGSLLEEMLIVYTPTLTTSNGGGGKEENIGVAIAPYLLYYSYLINGPPSLARTHCPWASKKIATDLGTAANGGGVKGKSSSSTALQLELLENQGRLSNGCRDHVVTYLQGLVDSCNSQHFEKRGRAITPDSRWAMMSSGAPQGGNYLFGGSTPTNNTTPSSSSLNECVCELWELEGVSGLCRPLLQV